MDKYCRFIENVYDGEKIIFHKDIEYQITHETEDAYYFGGHKLIDEKQKEYDTAIDKSYKGQLFKVITIE